MSYGAKTMIGDNGYIVDKGVSDANCKNCGAPCKIHEERDNTPGYRETLYTIVHQKCNCKPQEVLG